MKLAIVVSTTYWNEVTSKMLEKAQAAAQQEGAEIVQTIKVPGSFDIPLAVKKLLKQDEVQGVITLGILVQGKTDHDQLIAYTIADKIAQLSLDYEKPVVLGVNGPKMTGEQALARIPRAAEVTRACIEMIKALE